MDWNWTQHHHDQAKRLDTSIEPRLALQRMHVARHILQAAQQNLRRTGEATVSANDTRSMLRSDPFVHSQSTGHCWRWLSAIGVLIKVEHVPSSDTQGGNGTKLTWLYRVNAAALADLLLRFPEIDNGRFASERAASGPIPAQRSSKPSDADVSV